VDYLAGGETYKVLVLGDAGKEEPSGLTDGSMTVMGTIGIGNDPPDLGAMPLDQPATDGETANFTAVGKPVGEAGNLSASLPVTSRARTGTSLTGTNRERA